jgi:hypothetical protein
MSAPAAMARLEVLDAKMRGARPRDLANRPGRPFDGTSGRGSGVVRQGRKRIEMLFAYLKRILRMGRLRQRGPCGAQDEFLLAATAQNRRKLAKLVT